MEISLANERVYGDLRLTKVDKDYPNNKLTGAEFEVYRDTNGNKELDEGDELLGKAGGNQHRHLRDGPTSSTAACS